MSWGTDIDNRVGVPHPRSLPGLPKGTGALPWPMGVFSPDQDTHSKKCSIGNRKPVHGKRNANAAEKGKGEK